MVNSYSGISGTTTADRKAIKTTLDLN